MRAVSAPASPCCFVHRLSPVLPSFGPGFSKGARKRLRIYADVQRNMNGVNASTTKSWWQKRSGLAMQFLKEQQAQWLYRYFRDWRKDAFSDLQAVLLLTLTASTGLAAGKVLLLGESSKRAWEDFYHNAVVTFGEAWPPDTAPVLEQVSSIAMYLAGLIGFAVLLALVEQSVLQVYEVRVELGSPVLESGHTLVLAWCRSQADVSKLEGVLRQLCAAYANSDGRTLVVLCQRKKTEMEDLFSTAIPPQQRGGSRFVFRQGNPLNAGDLRLVAADDASAVLVLADSAVPADASDSQVLRVLVLLDESEVAAQQEGRPRPTPGHVVAEILSNDAMPLLKFVPSKPVLPLQSYRLNATRLAMLVTRPVVSHITDTMWDFSNSSAVYMHAFPQLAGQTVADVALRFEDGILLGLLEATTGFVLINPPPGYTLNAAEQLILLRRTSCREADVQPLPAAVPAPIGRYSAEAAAAAWRQSQQSLSMPMVVSCGCSDVGDSPLEQMDEAAAAVQDPVSAMQEQLQQQSAAQQGQQEQTQLLGREQQEQQQRDGGAAASQQSIEPQQQLQDNALQASVDGSSSSSTGLSAPGSLSAGTAALQLLPTEASSGSSTTSSSDRAVLSSTDAMELAAAGSSNGALANGGCAVTSWEFDDSFSGSGSNSDLLPPQGVVDLLQGMRPGVNSCRMFSLAESSMQLSRLAPLKLLVLGWGEHDFMAALLLALGTGSSALPGGSSVVFANSHAAEGSLQPALAAAGGPDVMAGLSVAHVRLDPLARCSWQDKLQLEDVNAAIVLCDTSWRHSLAPFSFGAAAAAAGGGAGAVYSSSPTSSGGGSMGGSGGSLDGGGSASSNGASAAAAASMSGAAGGAGSGSVFALGAGGRPGVDGDVLQLDALLLRVQLNLRSALQGMGREQEVNIITEKVGTGQDTRFEDKARLPLGVPVNLSSYSACMLSQLAFCPLMVLPGRSSARPLGAQIDPLIVDADLYADVGDRVSFWTLMRRAQLLGHVLLGYYLLPAAASDPIEAVLCPPGAMRHERRTWNKGDNRLKFIVLQDTEAASSQQQQQQQMRQEAVAASVQGSAAARAAAAAAKAAAEASARYYPVDGGWQWWIR